MKKIAVIGSGIGGLTAGCLLAKNGHAVTLFESHAAPGGYTAGFRRDGFYFESGTLACEDSGVAFDTFKELGVFDKFTLERHSFRYLSNKYDASPATYAEFKQMLYAAYPGQKEALERYFREVDPMYRMIAAVMPKGFSLAKLMAFLSFPGLLKKYGSLTTGEFAAKYFPEGSELHRMLSRLGFGYPNAQALVIGPALYSLYEDYWTVKEGFQALADALAERFKKDGGQLLLGSRVEKILTKDGAAVGVRSKGTDYPADYVISAGDYKNTFLSLLDEQDVAPGFREKVRRARVSEAVFVVYLGLSLSNEALKEKMKKNYVLYTAENPAASGGDVLTGHFKYSDFSVFSPSLRNPQHAPAGRSSLMLTAGAPHHWQGNWGGDDRQKYLQLKSQVMETLIARLDAVFPGIKQNIVFKDAATPRTFERYTANTDGATSAWTWNPHKAFYKDMFSLNVTTPVRNLLIGSCWALQLGGFTGALRAARACAKKIG